MIISHVYRYLFIQLPHAGSTAIGVELCENYAGVKTLHKHANYLEFLRVASADEKKYFVFSSIRNPLDEAVSIYLHFKTNPYQLFTDPKRLKRNGGWVDDYTVRFYQWFQETRPDFPTFFRQFYKLLPYDNLSCLSHQHFNYIIRFENIQADFAEVLKQLDIEQKRPLPLVNQTKAKQGSFLSYYPPNLQSEAVQVFGPFMRKWSYQFPAEWGYVTPSWRSQIRFTAFGFARRFYYKYLRSNSNRWAQQLGEKAKCWIKLGHARPNH
jgi:hypothetical protein